MPARLVLEISAAYVTAAQPSLLLVRLRSAPADQQQRNLLPTQA
ncbi:MAG: hypothetical protein WCI38_03150 [Chthoniobacterales bacterium]